MKIKIMNTTFVAGVMVYIVSLSTYNRNMG